MLSAINEVYHRETKWYCSRQGAPRYLIRSKERIFSSNTKRNQDFPLLNGLTFPLIHTFTFYIAIILYFNILYRAILKAKICNVYI